ncbi:hypothetical protein DPEC_G00152990 [Dallia pectoralis]|uniref:Uncharacterized protein n=1 Tax=Dallia pectoralis TaxID=75939 RepID=A0ACC2GK87_DALPE|nr:hypothetical protein DPEC_G00152990 [Dallia pectoralis]
MPQWCYLLHTDAIMVTIDMMDDKNQQHSPNLEVPQPRINSNCVTENYEPKRKLLSIETVVDVLKPDTVAMDGMESKGTVNDVMEPKKASNEVVEEVRESEEAASEIFESKEVEALRFTVLDENNLQSKVFESKDSTMNINESQEVVKESKELKRAATELKSQTSSCVGRVRNGDRSESDSLLQHLQCSYCMLQCKSHCSYLLHMAKFHPSRLDDTPVGRLGNAIFYQQTARLFHCNVCFHTVREFPRLYDHLLTRHCLSGKFPRGVGEEEWDEDDGTEREGQRESEREGEREGSISDGELLNNCSLPPSESMVEEKATSGPKEGQDVCIKGEQGGVNSEGSFQPSCWPLKRKRSSTASSDKDEQDEEEQKELQTSNNTKKIEKHKMEEEAFLTKYIHRRVGSFNCRLCGWQSKMKGRVIYHVSYKHDVPKPYSCKECSKVFILESSLLNHVYHNHRQGMYLCLFCPFSSHVLWGIKSHGNRCNARNEGGEEEEVGDEEE